MNRNATATHPRIGVPELAGICTYEEAARPGFGVEENVALLKRYNWVEQRLNDLYLTRLTATPEWEVKDAFALHTWLDAEHAKWLQERVAELRHPPHNFHVVPDDGLEAWLQEALRAQSTLELLVGLYRVIKPALLEAYREHYEKTNPLVDQPTRRILRFMAIEEEEMIAWGARAIDGLARSAQEQAVATRWEEHLRAYFEAAGGITGEAPGPAQSTLPPSRASAPLEPDWTPRRDARIDSQNCHFPPHWVYAQVERPAQERMLALVCKRLLEMDVPEMMASIIWKTREEALRAGKPKPWTYTSEMCRQVWDEARHSMMGEAWFTARGIDWTQVPLNIGFSQGLNQLATAQEAHAALYWIEQGLMPSKSGKAYEWRTARDSGDALAQLFMDYDWADEVLHVHIGHWIIEELGSRAEAERLGEEAFGRVMEIRRQAEVENPAVSRVWWPDFVE
ncbi:MAG: hypothetical protein JWN98_1212, partial [Abditibacteriota bacterium]|nr:hypothetical protein [Abditibacteriota bacterium]